MNATTESFDLESRLGQPLGPYMRHGDVLRCDYSRGAALVNPSDRTVSVDLQGTYYTVTGSPVNSLMLLPHSYAFILKIDDLGQV